MRLKDKNIFLTGSTGRLGRFLLRMLQEEGALVMAPARREWDITSGELPVGLQMPSIPDIIVHAAAYTNVPVAETDGRADCISANVYGSELVGRLAVKTKAKLVYISSDYVTLPEKSFYAWSKLAGESFVPRKTDMIVRTSFKQRGSWGKGKLEQVFHPVYTNADWTDVIAAKIVDAICLDLKGVVNIGTEEKTLKDLATQEYKDVIECSVEKADEILGYHYPRDCRMKLTI